MTDDSRAEEPLLSVRGVGFSHGALPALQNVSFDLRPGRHYIVAGPNGAGKSTLLDILANLKRPRTGAVRIAGRPLGLYAHGRLARLLALAPQEFQLDFSFSIREIVAMGRRPYLERWGRLGDDDEQIVAQAIDAMHLGHIAGKSVMALSGGEKRRCIVARALAQTTPVLLLDEPSSGLDIAQSLSVMALARSMAESGVLVITVSHDLNLAARYGHEFIFLKNGQLEAIGPTKSVFTDETLSRLYETDAKVSRDAFTGAPAVSFRTKEGSPAPAMPLGMIGRE